MPEGFRSSFKKWLSCLLYFQLWINTSTGYQYKQPGEKHQFFREGILTQRKGHSNPNQINKLVIPVMLTWKFNRCCSCWQFQRCLNNNRRKQGFQQTANLCPQKEAENTQERINAQQYPALTWTLSWRMWHTAADYNNFWNIFSRLSPAPQHWDFQLSDHESKGCRRGAVLGSPLRVSKRILSSLFKKAAEVDFCLD